MSEASPGSPPLTLAAWWPRPDFCVVRASGDLDRTTAPTLTRHLQEQTAGRPRDLVLDLAEVRFLDAAGVAVIVNAQHNRHGIHGRLRLTGVTGNRPVERVLDITELRPVLDIHDDLEALLDRLAFRQHPGDQSLPT